MSSTITAVPTRILALTAGTGAYTPPPAEPVQGPVPPPETPAPDTDTPEPSPAASVPLGQRSGAFLGAVLSYAAQGCAATAAAGQPLAVEADALLRQLRIHAASAEQFRAWAGYLRVPMSEVRVSRDLLGPVADLAAVRATNGWALIVRLSGPPVMELS